MKKPYSLILAGALAILSACGGGSADPVMPARGASITIHEVSDPVVASGDRQQALKCAWICGITSPIAATPAGLGLVAVEAGLSFTGDINPTQYQAQATAPLPNGSWQAYAESPVAGVQTIYIAMNQAANTPAGTTVVYVDNVYQLVTVNVYDSSGGFIAGHSMSFISLDSTASGGKSLPIVRFKCGVDCF